MNAKVMIHAIGEISDHHVMEFVDVKNMNNNGKGYIKIILPFVASLGLIILVSVGFAKLFYMPTTSPDEGDITMFPSENESNTGSEKVDEPAFDMNKVVWGKGTYNYENEGNEEVESSSDLYGTIQIAQSLENAMIEYAQEVVFAVYVESLYYREKDAIYEEFILKLGVEEDYMEKSVIYVTKAQIEALECPDNMGFVLHLANRVQEEDEMTSDSWRRR